MKNTIFFILLSVVLASCASKKKKAVPVVTCERTGFELSELNHLTEEQAQKWYKIKGDAYLEFKEEQVDVDVQIRMKWGELMWISISKASFPVAKVLFTADSAFFMDMINKQYMAADYELLQKKVGTSANFEALQGIFLGQSLQFQDSLFQWVTSTAIVMADQPRGDGSTTMQLSDETTLVRAQWVNCSTKEIEKQLYRLPAKEDELWVRYSKFVKDELINYPSLISLRAMREKQQQLLCNFEIKSIKSADEMNIPFEIPSDYEEMR